MRVAGGSGGRPASKSLFDRVRSWMHTRRWTSSRADVFGRGASICALFLVFVLFVSEFAALVSSGVEAPDSGVDAWRDDAHQRFPSIVLGD